MSLSYIQFIFIFQIKHQTVSAISASTRHNKEKLSTNCAQIVTRTVVTTLEDSNFRPIDPMVLPRSDLVSPPKEAMNWMCQQAANQTSCFPKAAKK